MAVLVALISSLMWGTADFVGGVASRRLPSVTVVGWSQVTALIVLLPLVLLTGGFPEPGGWLVWGIAASVTGVSGLICFYRALAIGTMGVVSPIAALGAAVPVFIAMARGERPTLVQVVGIVLAVAGTVLASGPEWGGAADSGAGRDARRSVVLALIAALCFGLTLTLLAEGSRSTSPLVTVTIMRFGSLVMFGAVALMARSLGGVSTKQLPVLVAIGLADAGANALFGVASTMGMVSVVAVLGSLYPVATVLLARWVLGERMRRVQSVGVAVALAGVGLLAAG